MKLAHSSDWHLGKTLFARPLIEDQRVALDELKSRLTSESIELLLLAGDLFDRSVPPEEAVQLLDDFLTDVVTQLRIPVCMIPGNHDSNTRVGAGANLLHTSGLHVFASPESVTKPFLHEKSSSKIAVFGVPYLEPGEWGAYLRPESPPRSHEEAIGLVLSHIEPQIQDLRARGFKIILLLHAYVMGGTCSESERPLSVGGSEMIPSELLTEFDYVALGHLHRPQTISNRHIRYSGSLFPYSQSESDQERGFVVVDLESKDPEFQFQFLPFRNTRKLRTIQGAFDNLLATESSRSKDEREDYVIALLSDNNIPFEAFRRLNSVLPNLLHVARKADWSIDAAESSETLHRKLQQELSDHEVLKIFVDAAATEPLSKADLDWLTQMFDKFHHSSNEASLGN
jgi:exonuclease SbcD